MTTWCDALFSDFSCGELTWDNATDLYEILKSVPKPPPSRSWAAASEWGTKIDGVR
jgi:hypothetical protein